MDRHILALGQIGRAEVRISVNCEIITVNHLFGEVSADKEEIEDKDETAFVLCRPRSSIGGRGDSQAYTASKLGSGACRPLQMSPPSPASFDRPPRRISPEQAGGSVGKPR